MARGKKRPFCCHQEQMVGLKTHLSQQNAPVEKEKYGFTGKIK